MKITFEDTTLEAKDMLAGIITTTDEELKFTMVATPRLEFNTAMQLIQSITIQYFHALIEQQPEELKLEVRDALYDGYNIMASSILNNIIPDKELRQDLDEDAILAAQAEMINAAYNKMTPEEKANALASIEKLKERLSEDIHGAEGTATTVPAPTTDTNTDTIN